MIKKIFTLLAVFAVCATTMAQKYTGGYPYLPTTAVIDTVMVPIKILRLTSNAGGVFEYSGKITYDLRLALNDSLAISLAFVPVAAGGTTLTPYEVNGTVGTIGFLAANGIGGTNEINFKVRSTGAPSGLYTARVTLVATQSRIGKTTDSLILLMTKEELVLQCHGNGALTIPGGGRDSPDIPRLGIPGYKMSNAAQCPCNSIGYKTGTPGPTAVSCTFDTAMAKLWGRTVAEEYWAKGIYMIEAPMINMPIDPRCGRSFEEFGEDPYLAGKITAAYCYAAQATGVGVIPKHWLGNEIETERHNSNSIISERTLREIYAYPFEMCIKEGKALGIMTSYNILNGIRASQSPTQTDILKYDWGYRGYTLSDWWGLKDGTAVSAANAGQDVELVNARVFAKPLSDAVTARLVSMERLQDMARRILRNKVYSGVIGKMDVASRTKYEAELTGAAHRQACLDIARKSIVLVKNTSNALPLNLSSLTTIAVVGTYASNTRLSGGGSGGVSGTISANLVSPLSGIRTKAGAKFVTTWNAAAVVVVVVGVHGETEDADRETLEINNIAAENELVNQIVAAGKKCIVVVTGGSPAKLNTWYSQANAVLVAHYPGEKQGEALADIIFGDVNPSGKLHCSWPVNDASMRPWLPNALQIRYEAPDTGFGYRYYDRMKTVPFLAFGHGLSYTTFEYSNIRFSANPIFAGEDVTVTVTVKNTGTKSGDEVAQLYVSQTAPLKKRPVKELRGFARVTLAAGEPKDVSFKLKPRDLAYFDDTPTVWRFVVQPDTYTIRVGGSSAVLPLSATLKVE